jgi:hypothetical protein
MIKPVTSSGRIFYRGPSMLDGSPVRLTATCLDRPSNNRKTGDCSQFWILPDDVSPLLRDDRHGICGSGETECPIAACCYLNWGQAPAQVWKTEYPDYVPARDRHLLSWKKHRYGAAGDPAAIPAAIWRAIRTQATQGWLGYTQFWRLGRFWHLRSWLMASCNTMAEVKQAESKGWKAYVAVPEPLPGLLACPYETSQGRIKCAQCGLCDGQNRTIQITQHGSPIARSAWAKLRHKQARRVPEGFHPGPTKPR